MNLTDGDVAAQLSFTAYTWKVPRKVTVKLNGLEEATLTLKPEEGEREYRVEMTIPTGNNMITFTSDEPPQPTGQASDSRELSFGMYGVALDAEP
jgi:hypothetical protein